MESEELDITRGPQTAGLDGESEGQLTNFAGKIFFFPHLQSKSTGVGQKGRKSLSAIRCSCQSDSPSRHAECGLMVRQTEVGGKEIRERLKCRCGIGPFRLENDVGPLGHTQHHDAENLAGVGLLIALMNVHIGLKVIDRDDDCRARSRMQAITMLHGQSTRQACCKALRSL